MPRFARLIAVPLGLAILRIVASFVSTVRALFQFIASSRPPKLFVN